MELNVSLLEAKTKIVRSNYKSDFIYENAKSGEYTFHSSKIYGLVGSQESGNWALSYLLTGWSRAKKIKIMVDGNDLPLKEVRNICCYIGREHYYDVFPIKKCLTLKRAIETGLKKSGNTIDTFQSIKEMFSLTSERENRSFKYLGNEHWRASLAIGYAYGKSIYCSDFMDGSMWEKYHSIMLEQWLDILRNKGAIILIPTDDETQIKSFVDEIYYF